VSKEARIMATSKRPDAERRPPENINRTAAGDRAPPAPDLDTPLYDRERSEADKARRDAATEAFRNEKAHERPPRHQA
jgi:hypothetical protein